jgi:hypothetical protein
MRLLYGVSSGSSDLGGEENKRRMYLKLMPYNGIVLWKDK